MYGIRVYSYQIKFHFDCSPAAAAGAGEEASYNGPNARTRTYVHNAQSADSNPDLAELAGSYRYVRMAIIRRWPYIVTILAIDGST